MAPTGFSPTATTAPGQAAGPMMAQAQRKVDPDQMPSPVSTCTHTHTHTLHIT